ncbi:MAG: hypothetical protein FWE70_01895 [Oscillospiraceae bacterium]|nr:hypothetical protein [Oscillospiraceae bacterium]
MGLGGLLGEVMAPKGAGDFLKGHYMAIGYRGAEGRPNVAARAAATASLLAGHRKAIYANDRIAGSIRGMFGVISEGERAAAQEYASRYPERHFLTNADHFAPDYQTLLGKGINGIIGDIGASLRRHAHDPGRTDFLEAARTCMGAFREMVGQYAEAAEASGAAEGREMAAACRNLTSGPPETFREALQLVWLAHVSFLCDKRNAMALGRMDQYLLPFYGRDVAGGRLSRGEAVSLLAHTFAKIGEFRMHGCDDVVNICIGGLRRDGSGGVSDLSHDILEAVRICDIPGPNLSARIYEGAPRPFLDACLQVIGTGLGYPALMNDGVNVPALARHGYSDEDCRDHCFVGCIENFIQGRQPPWSDGRFNTPKFLELALNDGVCMLTGKRMGPPTGEAGSFRDMAGFMGAFEAQIRHGAAAYMEWFLGFGAGLHGPDHQQPYLSCFCQDCIGRGLDINGGGALYPSAHGACGMGIATVADSLAAIEKVVFDDREADMATVRKAAEADFAGYGPLAARLRAAPKYGNDDGYVDKYAVWYVDFLHDAFKGYGTRDGGPIYIAMASNVQNVSAGLEVAATPDGRPARRPLSDAASPSCGRDLGGPTATMSSVSKPDYTKVACGTVLNQRYEPSSFADPRARGKLCSLIEGYFAKGGQEVQINAVSRETLLDAMENPESHGSLVVRVSGFSAYFASLGRPIQEDILGRTEHRV